MKILKIENSQGFYSISGTDYNTIDKITKSDLLGLVDLVLNGGVEYDEYNEKEIKNQAHQIIYKNICEKLSDLDKRKEEFRDESERLFLPEYEKYKSS